MEWKNVAKQHHSQTENGMVRGLQNASSSWLPSLLAQSSTGLFRLGRAFPFLTGQLQSYLFICWQYLMMRAIGEMLYMDGQHTFSGLWNTLVSGDSSQVGLTGYHWYFLVWQKYGCIELCAVLVSKLACLADSDCLLDYPWAQLTWLRLRCRGGDFSLGWSKIVTILALIATGIFR